MARFPVVLVLINIITCCKQGLCKGGKGLVCDYYYDYGLGIGNGTETCQSDDEYCFALWGEEQNERNKTLYGVVMKGCFALSAPELYCQDDCIQIYNYAFKREDVSGFCCCNTTMCNTNFTAIDYADYGTTVASTTSYSKSI